MHKLQIVVLSILFVFMPFVAGCPGGEEAPQVLNRAPVPTAPNITIAQNTSGTSQVNPNDPDTGQTFTFAITTPPLNGTASVSAGGLVTYTPNAGFSGLDILVVTVTDNGTPPLSGTVTINVTITPAPIVLEGLVSKGPAINCAVRVFVLNSDGSRGTQVAGDPVNPIVTRDDGQWGPINIPGDIPGPFTIEARRAAGVVEGGRNAANCRYLDESLGATAAQPIPDNAPILGLLPAGARTAAITPLTTAMVLAVQATLQAATDSGRVASPAATVTNAVANATQTFGFDPVRTIPPRPDQVLQNTTPDQREYAALLAGISQVVRNASGGATASATTLAASLDLVARDLTDGRLDGRAATVTTTTISPGVTDTVVATAPLTTNVLATANANTGSNLTSLQDAVTNYTQTAPPDLRPAFQTAADTAPVSITPTGLLGATPPQAPQPSAADINIVKLTGQVGTGTTPVTVAPGPRPPLRFDLTGRADPTKGIASVDPVTGVVSYTTLATFNNGSDALVVTVTDTGTASLPSLAGAASINVFVTTQQPTALTLTTDPPSPVQVALAAQVVQINFTPQVGGPREFSFSDGPNRGTVRFEGDSGRMIYTPTPGVAPGPDSVLVRLTILNNANDRVVIATGTVTITFNLITGTGGTTQ